MGVDGLLTLLWVLLLAVSLAGLAMTAVGVAVAWSDLTVIAYARALILRGHVILPDAAQRDCLPLDLYAQRITARGNLIEDAIRLGVKLAPLVLAFYALVGGRVSLEAVLACWAVTLAALAVNSAVQRTTRRLVRRMDRLTNDQPDEAGP